MKPEWPTEPIPDADFLLMRVHRVDLDPVGVPKPGAFKNRPDGAEGMSTNWDRYATPQSTRESGRKPGGEYAVVSLCVGPVRQVPGQAVEHRPLPDNRAHSEVVGTKDPEVRLALRELHIVVLQADPEPPR